MEKLAVKTQKEKDRMYYFHSAIGLVIMFGFGMLPTFSTITPYGMKMLGILLGLIYLWSFVEMGWPSLVGLIAYLLTGGTTMADIMAKGFGSQQVMISIFATAFAFAIASQGVFDWLAKKILALRVFKGRPWVLTFGFIFIVYILNCVYAGMAILFLVWTLLPKIGELCDLEKQHPWYGLVVVGTVFALVMAECTFPFRPMALFMISLGSGLMPIGEIPFIGYIVFMFITISVMTILYLLIGKFVLRIDLSKMGNVDVSKMVDQSEKLTGNQKFCLFLLVLFILCMILVGSSSLLPDSAIKTALSSLTIVGVAFIFFAFACIYRIDGKPLLNVKEVAKDIPWDICLLLAVILTFCTNVASAETGISGWLAAVTSGILGGKSPLMFMVIMFIITIVATNFLNNTVVIMVMLNITAAYVGAIDLNCTLILILMIIFSQIAFLLPASSVWGGFCHSQGEMCGKKNIYIPAVGMIVAAILTLIIAIPLGATLF